MRKLKIVKHLYSTDRNIYGEVVRRNYEYYIAVRRFGFLWQPLKFYYNTRVSGLLAESKVIVGYARPIDATSFDTEADAILVRLDIEQHPDKYIEAT